MYEIFISALAVIAVLLSVLSMNDRIFSPTNQWIYRVDTGILIIFTVDYFVRLVLTRSKKIFIKQNIPDLIAIIPFSSVFRIFRVARLFRIARMTRIFKFARFTRALAFASKFQNKINRFIKTNGFIYMLYLTIATILLGAGAIYLIEYGLTIHGFGDALWWSFVTATTVGYGDISPATALGRFVAAILMLVGIGFIGMLTGTIATYFLSHQSTPQTKTIGKVVDLSDLEEERIKEIMNYIEFVRQRK